MPTSRKKRVNGKVVYIKKSESGEAGSGASGEEASSKSEYVKIPIRVTMKDGSRKNISVSIQNTDELDSIENLESVRISRTAGEVNIYRHLADQAQTNALNKKGEVFITEPTVKEGQWVKTSDVPMYKAGKNNIILEKTNGYVTRVGSDAVYIQKYGKGYALNYKGRVDGNYSSIKKAKEAVPEFAEKLQRVGRILEEVKGEFAILNKNKGRVSKSVMKEISSDDRRRISERVYK